MKLGCSSGSRRPGTTTSVLIHGNRHEEKEELSDLKYAFWRGPGSTVRQSVTGGIQKDALKIVTISHPHVLIFIKRVTSTQMYIHTNVDPQSSARKSDSLYITKQESSR